MPSRIVADNILNKIRFDSSCESSAQIIRVLSTAVVIGIFKGLEWSKMFLMSVLYYISIVLLFSYCYFCIELLDI